MFDPKIEFQRELAAAAEKDWQRLDETQRDEILRDYDIKAQTVGLEWAIFAEQWKRERGG